MTEQFNPRTGSRGIEWCDETRNAIGGCLHECKWEMPDGTTAVCYAKQIAENGLARAGYPHGFAHHYWRPNALKALTAGNEPGLIFCDSMSDLFGVWIPDDQVRAVLGAMRGAPHHTYQSLTKAPKRLTKFIDDMPPNLWVGVSSAPDWFMGRRLTADQQQRYTRSALAALAEVKERTNNVVWMSLEPVSWNMAPIFAEFGHVLDWAVIGAAMNGGRYFQPDPRHVAGLLDTFLPAGVDIFYKGNIKPTFDGARRYDFGSEDRNRWREDFPVRSTGRPGDGIPGPAPAVLRRQRMARQHGWPLNQSLTPAMERADSAPAVHAAAERLQLGLFG